MGPDTDDEAVKGVLLQVAEHEIRVHLCNDEHVADGDDEYYDKPEKVHGKIDRVLDSRPGQKRGRENLPPNVLVEGTGNDDDEYGEDDDDDEVQHAYDDSDEVSESDEELSNEQIAFGFSAILVEDDSGNETDEGPPYIANAALATDWEVSVCDDAVQASREVKSNDRTGADSGRLSPDRGGHVNERTGADSGILSPDLGGHVERDNADCNSAVSHERAGAFSAASHDDGEAWHGPAVAESSSYDENDTSIPTSAIEEEFARGEKGGGNDVIEKGGDELSEAKSFFDELQSEGNEDQLEYRVMKKVIEMLERKSQTSSPGKACDAGRALVAARARDQMVANGLTNQERFPVVIQCPTEVT